MTTWIVTTGNSDIRVKDDRNWGDLCNQVIDDLDCGFSPLSQIDAEDRDVGYTAPARILGLVYANQPDYYDDLQFPLLDTFRRNFNETKKPLKIIILLTDQSGIFDENNIIYEKCPYWQDTCTLEPLFKKYFQKNFKIEPEFLYLKPESGEKGLDNWDQTLQLVEKTLGQALDNLDYRLQKTIYVSHQAGTPAISSAVQFVSLGKGKNITFLVSNESYNEDYHKISDPQEIKVSNYWRGIQIQKAKQLIITGFPGAALKVLEELDRIDKNALLELEEMVNFFNLSSANDQSKDFEISEATQRIVDALDLISFFLKHRNYLQAIMLLSAAQETFLKVAIIKEIGEINDLVNGVKVSELIRWTQPGLFLIQNNELSKKLNLKPTDSFREIKKQIFSKLKFPISFSRAKDEDDIIFHTNKNSAMLQWLGQLRKPRTDFKAWALLTWSCDDSREHENDLRNQLMHNLRGVEDRDVIEYLLGYKTTTFTDVIAAYNDNVKTQFLNSLNVLNLPFKREKLSQSLQKIADLIN